LIEVTGKGRDVPKAGTSRTVFIHPPPKSVCQGEIVDNDVIKLLVRIDSHLPGDLEIGEVKRNQPMPGWNSLVSRAVVIPLLRKGPGTNPAKPAEERKVFEICLVPADWVGIRPDIRATRWRVDGPFVHVSKMRFSGELKGCYVGAVGDEFPKDLRKELFSDECTLEKKESLAVAEKVFVGKQEALDDEVAYLMGDASSERREFAIFSLDELGIPARQLFAKSWRAQTGEARRKLYKLALRLGMGTPEFIDEGLKDSADGVRLSAIREIEQCDGEKRLRYLGTLESFAKDTNSMVRMSVARTLRVFPMDKAQPVLIGLMKDSEWRVQYGALDSLRLIGAKGYGKELLTALTGTNWFMRDRILEAVGEMKDPDLVSPLLEFALKPGMVEIGKRLRPDMESAGKAIKGAYRNSELRGDVKGGVKLTILTVKKSFAVNEPIHVFHVAETVQPGIELRLAGPLPVQDFIDGRPAGAKAQLGVYNGRVSREPCIAVNYEITTHRFPTPGSHSIQWVEDGFVSNAIEVDIVENK
jgi:hypothetical protein